MEKRVSFSRLDLGVLAVFIDLRIHRRHLQGAGRRRHRRRRSAAAAAELQTATQFLQRLVEHHEIHVLAQQMEHQEVADLEIPFFFFFFLHKFSGQNVARNYNFTREGTFIPRIILSSYILESFY